MRILAAAFAVVSLSLPAAAVRAQGKPLPTATSPACDGVLVNVRISDIKPESSMEKFLAAVAAQKAWYDSHGFKDDKIFVSKLLVRDPDTKSFTYTDKQVMTYHFYSPSSSSNPAHDAAWDAFVKLFSDASVVKESVLNCVPKEMVPEGRE